MDAESCDCEWHSAFDKKLSELKQIKVVYKRIDKAQMLYGETQQEVVPEYNLTKSFAIQKELLTMLEKYKCPKKKTHVGNGKPQGEFAFTLTKSDKDVITVGDMLTAVRKIMTQKSCPVIKYAWYYEEKGRDGNGDPIHPHIHGIYETESGGRIEAKHFKRAWSIWDEKKPMGQGFRGGYHRTVKHNESYRDYIEKDGGMSETRGYQPTDT